MYDKTFSEQELRAEEARFAGFLGVRAMREARALEYMPWEEQENVELVSGPREDKRFVDIEDLAADAWSAGALWGDDDVSLFEAAEKRANRAQRKQMRDAFFARLDASIAKQAELTNRANQARVKNDLYTLMDEAMAFDTLTPAWMFSCEHCGVYGLQPLKPMDELIMPVVERAEGRVEAEETKRKRMRDAFFARLEASIARQAEFTGRANRARSRTELYALIDEAMTFDNFTPAWMFSSEQCAAYDLRPLKRMDELIMPAIVRAEGRVEKETRRKAQSPNAAKTSFVPVMMQNKRGASTVAYTEAYMKRKAKEGFRVVRQLQ